MFSTTTVRRRNSSKKSLKLLKELTQDEELVLPESDKNLGWSLNTPFWLLSEGRQTGRC